MKNDTLFQKLINSPAFVRTYNSLLHYSVCSQFPTLQTKFRDKNIDWEYLITCASLLSQSKGGRELDIAFRICQTCISHPDCSASSKAAAASIFSILTNTPAIELAKKRKLISENYIESVPFLYALDVLKKDFESSIEDGADRPLVKLNKFQMEVYGKATSTNALSISAPTSSGKSFILLRLIKDCIASKRNAKVVYLVPTRALIQQVELDIKSSIKSTDHLVEVTSVPVRPDSWDESACIMVFTQERLQWMLNDNISIAFDLVVVDEAQKIGDGARGILLQQVVQELIVRNTATRCLFASPMTSNPDELLKIINAKVSSNSQVASEHVTVNQNLMWLNQKANNAKGWEMYLCQNNCVSLLGEIQLTHRATKSSDRLPIIAFELGNNKSGNLIYVNGAAEAEKAAIQIKSLVENQTPTNEMSPRIKELIKLIKKTIHPNYKLAETLKAGVGFHYGNMPLAIRNGIEELFKAGAIKFLVCTSTLIEGVNLPATTIYMRGPQKGKNIPMNEMDFWNLAGRAGRQGKEFQGNIICIEANNETVWKTPVPTERKKYPIYSAIEKVYKDNCSIFLKYLFSGDIEDKKLLSSFEYAYTYFLTEYYKGGLKSQKALTEYGESFCEQVSSIFDEELSKIELPKDILLKNQGVPPLAQQSLLNYFIASNKPAGELIPPLPEDDDASEKYLHIIGRISRYLTNDPPQLNHYRSIYITNWMRGYGLARIIAGNIEYFKKKDPRKKLDTIIRDTMKDIEEYARFRFLKYSSCYTNILAFYFLKRGESESIKKLPPINLWLEFGASKQTQISLMGMGFTRTAALEISELMVVENYDKGKCLNWFKRNNLDALGLSEIIVGEIRKIIE